EVVLFAFIAMILWVIAVGLDARRTFALRPPDSWRTALGLMAIVFLAVLAVSGIVSPFLHPGREQGIVTNGWHPSHAAAFAANFLVFTFVGPVVEELTFRGLGSRLLVSFDGGRRPPTASWSMLSSTASSWCRGSSSTRSGAASTSSTPCARNGCCATSCA